MKGPIIAGVVILVLALSFYFFDLLKEEEFDPNNSPLGGIQATDLGYIEDMCFYAETVNKRTGVVDFYSLNIYAIGNQVEGNLDMAFGDKPEKKGIFFGTIGTVKDGFILDAWWDAYEGSTNKKEELRILIEDDVAKIGMGDMKDNGDGTYFYRSKNNLSFSMKLNKIGCK